MVGFAGGSDDEEDMATVVVVVKVRTEEAQEGTTKGECCSDCLAIARGGADGEENAEIGEAREEKEERVFVKK